MKAVCGWSLLVWMYFIYRWWRLFRSFLTFLYQPFSLITDLCPPLISHHCPLREGKVKLSLWNLKHLLLIHTWERNKPFYHIVETHTSRLINAEPCAKMVVRNFLPDARLISAGPLIFESPLFISPPFFWRSVPVCNEEEDAGFTGKRLNSKMVVFSGSKTSYLPKMMTLYEQCIRVLQNNIDCEQHSFGSQKMTR